MANADKCYRNFVLRDEDTLKCLEKASECF
jgi:hypothetical protein